MSVAGARIDSCLADGEVPAALDTQAGGVVSSAFARDGAESSRIRWRLVAHKLRPKAPRLAAPMDGTEDGALATMSFPWGTAPHCTRPIPSNAEIKRRTDVVGFGGRRYMTLESAVPVNISPSCCPP